MSGPVDVLALGAHPDDVEAGCGGTLLRARAAGLTVAVADLTDGELATQGDPHTRARERDRASKLLGLTARVGLSLPDGGLNAADLAQRASVVGLLRELRPRIVLAPFERDRHPDHAAAGRLARDAAFFAGVRRYPPTPVSGEGAEPGHPSPDPHRPASLFHYMLHEPFQPSFVVDVSDVWGRRTAALLAYESQFGGPAETARTMLAGPRFLEVQEQRAGFYGAMIGCERGEPFWSAGPLGLDGVAEIRAGRSYRMFV